MKKLTGLFALVAIPVLTVLAGAVMADNVKTASREAHDLLGVGVGLVGYDPVSYFPEGGSQPAKGHILTSTEYDGVIYRFASEEHKSTFEKNPARYLPAYGGWCTWAMAVLAKRVDVDPEAYVLKNGRLYVFYRDPKLDTRAKFLEDPDGMLAKAEANWAALSR
jgi:hypothetical protein